jgi:hypothetical protein
MTIVLILLGSSLVALIWGIHNTLGIVTTAKYNCSLAEISPDYTPAMKEECRQLRSQQK